MTCVPASSGAAKLTSSSSRSNTVCSRRAPIFSLVSLTRIAKVAICSIAVGTKIERDAFGRKQRFVLLDQGILRLGQDRLEILCGQRIELHANREAPLQFRNQVRRLADVECTRSDEQHVIGFHRAVFGVHGRAFDDR